jgi:hypothetical protein
MLGFVVTEETFVIAVEEGAGCDHFGVEQGVLRQEA